MPKNKLLIDIKMGLAKIGSYILTIFLFVTLIGNTFSQDQEGEMYFSEPRKKSARIRFDLINNLIIIPIKINDSDTLRFILDTGVRTTLITELADNESVFLNYASQVKVHGLGGGEPLDAYHSIGNFLKISDVIGKNITVNILLENVFHLSEKLGFKVNGLIGYDFFRNFVIDINYQAKILTIYRTETYKAPKRGFSVIPIEIFKDKPYLNTNVKIVNDHPFPVKLLIDTGASDPVWLFNTTDFNIQVPAKHIELYLGKGLNGDVHGEKGRIHSIQLGKFELQGPITSFPDSVSIKHVIALDDRNGSIGGELLRRFRVIVDYTNRTISLRRNTNYTDPFSYNMSGIELSAPFSHLPVFIISFIFADSPASFAGLKIGDQIISINRKMAVEYKLNDIYELFLGKDDKLISMVVLRDGQEFRVSFRLKKEI
jgi:hypothetical protein